MQVPEINPQQAAALLADDPGAVYLDVRTPEEFAQARPAGAWNVPLYLPDPASGVPQVNQEFTRIVAALFERDALLVCGCATGVRSAHAVMLLQQLGFARAVNVDAGFAGQHDPFGRVVAAGWAELGLPVETGDAGERSYEALRRRAEERRAADGGA